MASDAFDDLLLDRIKPAAAQAGDHKAATATQDSLADSFTHLSTSATGPFYQDWGRVPVQGHGATKQGAQSPVQQLWTAGADSYTTTATPQQGLDVFDELVPRELNSQAPQQSAVQRAPQQYAALSPSRELESSFVPSTPVAQPLSGWDAFEAVATSTLQKQSGASYSMCVDGLNDAQVGQLFREADVNGDGWIGGQEAMQFFHRTGLPEQDLQKIWSTVEALYPSDMRGKGLPRQHFPVALRLVALAQAHFSLTPDNINAALDDLEWLTLHGSPLPPPKLDPLPAIVQGLDMLSADSDTFASGDLDSFWPTAAPAALPGGGDTGGSPFKRKSLSLADLHGTPVDVAVSTLALGAEGGLQVLSNKLSGPGDFPPSPKVHLTEVKAPLNFEARLPPLKPKTSAKLTMLAAGCGSLLAGPSTSGGLLQWGRPEGDLGLPLDVEEQEEEAKRRGETDLRRFRVEAEDADSARCSEVKSSDTKRVTCMLVDHAERVLWTGHEDGKVVAWSMADGPGLCVQQRRMALRTWQAHKIGAVTALARTAWGELWTGSSRGFIRVWQHMGRDANKCMRELRRPGGARPHGGAIMALAEAGDQVVWSASDKTLVLWSSRTGEFLGRIEKDREREIERFGSTDSGRMLAAEMRRDAPEDLNSRTRIDHHKGLPLNAEGRLERAESMEHQRHVSDQSSWAVQSDKRSSEFFEKFADKSGKAFNQAGKAAKILGRLGAKLTRNIREGDGAQHQRQGSFGGSAGAADPDDPPAPAADSKARKLAAVAVAADGSVWVGFKRGRLEHYTPYGRCLSCRELGKGIRALCMVAGRLWLGLADGCIGVLLPAGPAAANPSLRPVITWPAHEASVLALAPAGSRVYSLAADGSVRGWSAAAPGSDAARPPAKLMSYSDDAVWARYAEEARQRNDLTRQETLEVLAVTWNVNQQKPQDLDWLTQLVKGSKVAVVGLQEIEVGGTSVAFAAAKDAVMKSLQEKGNANAQWWSGRVLEALQPGGPVGEDSGTDWVRVGLRQLSGMLVLVFARRHFKPHIGEVSSDSVACGVLGVGGNKGAVAVSFTLHRRRVTAICSHFTAHQGNVEQRNQNFQTIVRQLAFTTKPMLAAPAERPDSTDTGSDAGASEDGLSELADNDDVQVQGQGMRDAELLVWCGDFNYRLDCSYDEALEKIRRGQWQELLAVDQLTREQAEGRVFRYLREGPISFKPTYKFDKNNPGEHAYDSSEKRRVPAWTDRIFFRGSNLIRAMEEAESPSAGSRPDVAAAVGEEITVACERYGMEAGVCVSDHKPVFARLVVSMPVALQDRKRLCCAAVLQAAFPQLPELAVAVRPTALRLLQDAAKGATIYVANSCAAPVAFALWRDENGELGLPEWLEVYPVSGIVEPKATLEITVKANTPGTHAAFGEREQRARLTLLAGHAWLSGGEKHFSTEFSVDISVASVYGRNQDFSSRVGLHDYS